YFDQSSNTSYLFGRPASVSTQALDPASYQLKLITEVPNAVVTSITHNPQAGSTNPTLYFLASNSSIRYFSQATNDPSLNRLGIIWGNGEPEYYTYAQLGLDPDFNLQTLVFLPETADYDAQLMVGGLGGAWLSTIQSDGSLGMFEAMDWQGLPADTGPGSWLLDLKYDPSDDVVMASTLGQGSWLWSRSGELVPAPERSPGFSVTSSLLPQALSNYFDRKGRDINGYVSVQLVRTAAQQGQTVTAELVLENAAAWQTNLGVYTDISKTNDLTTAIAATDNQIRVPLVFAPGVETLTLQVTPKRPELVLPDITLDMAVVSDAFSGETAQGEIILYPNAGQPTYYQTATEGVFYNYASAFGLSSNNQVGGTAGDRLLTAVLPATLPQGTQIGYYLTNADGSIGSVQPGDPAYQETVLSQFQSLAYATAPTDALSLTAERALNAFADGEAFRETESRYFGNTQLTDAGLAFLGNTVGVALVLPDGSLYTSVGDNAFEFVPGAENTFVFDPTGDRLEASLAPAGGQVFVTESTDYQWKVARLGDYESGYGLFRVDNLTGLIDGITPGAPTYAAKALERALSQGVDGFTGQGLPEKGEYISQSLTGLAENAYYAAFITPDRPVDEALALLQAPSAGPLSEYVGFTIAGANQGTLASLPLGSSLFAFEDAGLFGDRDFNDLIMDLQPVSLNVA
ncbi:MAG: DUF4114 domain-containing protein, partial [Synechocystis sp.]|nr:DUF4114 domain-containing protein [Synechocystis sp.]